jgi:formylglycine-generating enzyme required for sulfatase activity
MGSLSKIQKILLVLIGTMGASPASTKQDCDGIQTRIGEREVRCIKPDSGDSFKDCPHCPEMVVIPAGGFTMGASRDEEVATSREDQATVVIRQPFAVGRFAVTRGEFAAFIAATDHKIDQGCFRLSEPKRDANRNWRSPGFSQDDRHPVVCVSWDDANAYTAWLTASTGKSYRLLSEAEREYVTRAGSNTAFWWGSTISSDQANYDGSISYGASGKGEVRNATVPVDSFAANPWGLYNVHGNVWEWTADCWNEKNAGNPGDGSARIIGDCSLRVLRGASFANAPHTLRAARRISEPLGNRLATFGFRVARSLQP